MKQTIPIVLSLFILGLAPACASDEGARNTRRSSAEQIKSLGAMVDDGPSTRFDDLDDKLVRSFDINNDNAADLWKIFRQAKLHADDVQETLKLVRKEVDSNFDGQVDIWLIYNEQERLMREEADTNFDGSVDLVERFEKGRVVQRELFNPGQENPRARKRYREGRLYLIEVDEDDDGSFDRWEVFFEGRLTQIGHDTNEDGEVDYWDDFSQRE